MKTQKSLFGRLLPLAACLGAGAIAYAAVTIDDDGVGFVGKGDIQNIFGWNNKSLQDNADNLQFRVSAVTETTWTCSHPTNGNVQNRSRTTSYGGLLTAVARLRNQITGFNLNGWDGEVSESIVDGPPLHSCPTDWTLAVGSTNEVGGSVEVSVNGTDWFELPITE